jgi:hypothetical protein
MLRFYAEKFLKAHHLMSQLEHASNDFRSGKATSIDANAQYFILKSIDEMLPLLKEMGLSLSFQTATMLRDYFDKNRTPHALALGGDLARRMHDELELKFFFALSSKDADLFMSRGSRYGDNAAVAFPSVDYEVDEAAKCLALERSTASAFHSIRTLEAAIRAIARCFGIPDPTRSADRSWFNILKSIKAEYERRWPTNSARSDGDGLFFEELHAALSSMQNPYRNATMHLDKVYTPEDARYIFEVVGGIMRKISSRMDENGDPKA